MDGNDEVLGSVGSLRLRLIETATGYMDGADLAEGGEVVDLFLKLGGLHIRHATELGGVLVERGCMARAMPPEDAMHDEVLRVRSLLAGFDSNLMRGLLAGEEGIACDYDSLIGAMVNDVALWSLLAEQRTDLERELAVIRQLVPGPDRNKPH